MSGIFVSPAEPEIIRRLGQSSMVPETLGADVLWVAHGAFWGLQRKTLTDLLASRDDGRLAKEIRQWALLGQALVLLEGVRVDAMGYIVGSGVTPETGLTPEEFASTELALHNAGAWVIRSPELRSTPAIIQRTIEWSRKTNHGGLSARPPQPAGAWGTKDSRGWQAWLLESFPGISRVRAEAILDHFGRLPIVWDLPDPTRDLCEVKGVGPKTAEKLASALGARPRPKARTTKGPRPLDTGGVDVPLPLED